MGPFGGTLHSWCDESVFREVLCNNEVSLMVYSKWYDLDPPQIQQQNQDILLWIKNIENVYK